MSSFFFPLAGDVATGLDCKTDEATLDILTMPDTVETFKPIGILLWAANIDTVTVQPTIAIGTNSTDFDNVLAATALAFTASGKTHFIPVTNATVLGSTDVVKARVVTPATATGYLVHVALIGTFQGT